jgi:hypothetical protein
LRVADDGAHCIFTADGLNAPHNTPEQQADRGAVNRDCVESRARSTV